ncbi:MAG: hypothetical protein PF518_12795 [Spirochaetaceae bacterium]|jgi:hypothetical protein|nr:hypothetical protein [Spirochaetaceae bacterium]
MLCNICNKEIYGVLIQGHCRECAEKKITSFDLLKQELIDSNNHVEELLTELRRLSIKNQALQRRRRIKNSDSPSDRKGLMTEEEYKIFIEKLGKYRDSDLAKEYGVSDSYVCRTRQKLGIPTYANNEDLWEKIDPVIFSRSIRAVANEYGIDRGRIERRRKKLIQAKEDLIKV